MSLSTELTHRESIPVEIGGLTLYCEHFKASAVKSFAEEPSASGKDVITNCALKLTRLTFSGRIFGGDRPMELLINADGLMRSQNGFEVTYRGVGFADCYLQSYSLEDCGEDYLKASITVVTNSPSTESEAEK